MGAVLPPPRALFVVVVVLDDDDYHYAHCYGAQSGSFGLAPQWEMSCSMKTSPQRRKRKTKKKNPLSFSMWHKAIEPL